MNMKSKMMLPYILALGGIMSEQEHIYKTTNPKSKNIIPNKPQLSKEEECNIFIARLNEYNNAKQLKNKTVEYEVQGFYIYAIHLTKATKTLRSLLGNSNIHPDWTYKQVEEIINK